jgi:benzoylformate decarboxylase
LSVVFVRFTVRRFVLDLLRRLRHDHDFGNPGSTELPLFFDFPEDFRYALGPQSRWWWAWPIGFAQATTRPLSICIQPPVSVTQWAHSLRYREPHAHGDQPQQARSILPFDPFCTPTRRRELPKPYVKWSVEPACADTPLAIAPAIAHAAAAGIGALVLTDDW